jgi:hypothetical protein
LKDGLNPSPLYEIHKTHILKYQLKNKEKFLAVNRVACLERYHNKAFFKKLCNTYRCMIP